MLGIVLAALPGAGRADLGALAAQRLRKRARACHEAGREAADLGAVHVQRNAARHHLDILLAQAGARAAVAGGGAGFACVDTVLEVHLVHGASSPERACPRVHLCK
jgi:hypothetical protein